MDAGMDADLFEEDAPTAQDDIEDYVNSLTHSPGPWEVEETKKGHLRVVSRFYRDETPGICGDHSKHWRLSEDDARLIASAPDLLAALKDCRDAFLALPDGLAEALPASVTPTILKAEGRS